MTLSKPSTEPLKHEIAFFPDIGTLAASSSDFRRVFGTGLYSQLVVMTIPVDGEIGDEVHTVDQILTLTSETGKATIAGNLIIVPAGTQHQFINTSPTPLILCTVYSPAEHRPDAIHQTKEEGDQESDDEIDEAPEWSQQPKANNEKKGLVKAE